MTISNLTSSEGGYTKEAALGLNAKMTESLRRSSQSETRASTEKGDGSMNADPNASWGIDRVSIAQVTVGSPDRWAKLADLQLSIQAGTYRTSSTDLARALQRKGVFDRS